jgi:serine/threonine protein kinase
MTSPRLIGRYELQAELGRGGMATVYRAHDPRFKRDVAIKVLPREFLHDPTFRARFEREAQTIAGLEHYAIVPVYDFGEHDGQPYLVMRYMPGGSLTDRIMRGPLSLADAAAIIAPIAAALDDVHDAGVIHRDVKPANILFGRSGQAHLTDFGIVKVTEATAQLTGSGMVGTPAYMAPEMTRKGGIGPLVDVYALGVTVFQILTGRLPYEADTPMGTALAHITTPIPDIHDFRPDLTVEAQTVIERALAKDPADRYQRAGDLADALRTLGAGEPRPADDRPTPTPRGQTRADRVSAVEAPPRSPGDTISTSDTWDVHPASGGMERLRRGVPGWAWISGAVAGVALLAGGLLLAGMIGPPVTPTPEPTGEELAIEESTFQITEMTSEPTEGESATVELTHQPTESTSELAEEESTIGERLLTLEDHTGTVNSVAFAPDGATLASASDDSTIILWDAASGERLRTLEGHTSEVNSVAFAPDGATLASASDDSTIILWDATSGERLRTLEGHTSEVTSVAFAPDGGTLASGSYDDTVILWDATSGEQLRTFGGHTDVVWNVAFAPDGATLASGSYDGTIILWNTATGEHLRTLDTTVSVDSIAFSPDGTMLASDANDNTVILWDAASGERLRTLKGHAYYVTSVAFSPDGTTLASGSGDDAIILWDVASGERLRTLVGHTGYVTSVAFSPDGSMLASTSEDGTIILWDVEP